jgi:hypothetical protein
MNQQQIELLWRASERAVITAEQRSKLKLENPYAYQGPVAEAMQLAVSQLDPMQARVWRDAAGATMSLAAAAASAGLADRTPAIDAELARMNPQTGDERVAQLVADATANGNPFAAETRNITAAMRLEIEAPDVAARLKAQAQPAAPAHNFTDGEVAVLQRHGYVLPS